MDLQCCFYEDLRRAGKIFTYSYSKGSIRLACIVLPVISPKKKQNMTQCPNVFFSYDVDMYEKLLTYFNALMQHCHFSNNPCAELTYSKITHANMTFF